MGVLVGVILVYKSDLGISVSPLGAKLLILGPKKKNSVLNLTKFTKSTMYKCNTAKMSKLANHATSPVLIFAYFLFLTWSKNINMSMSMPYLQHNPI